jgi:hypothetical protein
LVVGDGGGVFEHFVVFRDALPGVRIWRAGGDENADYKDYQKNAWEELQGEFQRHGRSYHIF